VLNDEALKPHPSEKHLDQFVSSVQTNQSAKLSGSHFPSLKELGFEASDFQYPSPEIERKLLGEYANTRNTPSVLGTSRLGVHLRFGTISIRECVRMAKDESETWLNELIWREFFMQILFHFPHVVRGPFREEYSAIKFRHDEKQFQAWCEGRTGYPIVDAGMRELNATGFMHNRVRMIAASFLVKHLLIDPKWGEAYFARKLLDFDLASNNGNWQWVAGTGCDAAPYFRVFSPEAQEKKFDSKRVYIKKWIPEIGTAEYPEPIVDHAMARARVLAAYNLGLGKKAPEPSRKTSKSPAKRSSAGQPRT
jgi:deoxyribodipyrimidine photo-lyase